MTRPTPSVSQYMTPSPHSIGAEQTLAQARTVMHEHKVRHLPVLDGGELVGVVTEGDVHFVESLEDVDLHAVTVAEAMTEPLYTVTVDTPLDDIVAGMASRNCGSAVVVQGAKIVGIFTTLDACRAFADALLSGLAA
jgi:acetoin utilization protein AcuB